MLEVNLFDDIFRHCETSSALPPQNLIWRRDLPQWTGATVFTEDFIPSPIVDKIISGKKIAWLLESKEVKPEAYDRIIPLLHKFDYVFTHDKFLLEAHPDKTKFVIPASQRELQQYGYATGVFPKSKLVSTIVSPKRQTTGHRFRHEIVDAFRNRIDVFGRAYRPIQSVSDGLKDYMFSITVENSYYDFYFTEKILNCFWMGTVPIYWGCPSIGKFFNPNGVISFQHLGELSQILTSLSESQYTARLSAIRENFERVQEYISAEEWIFKHCQKFLS